MKILITGSNGFLGKQICHSFKKDNQLFTLSQSSANYNVNLAEFVPVFSEIFDLVIHSAGLAHSVPNSENESQRFFDVNVTGTINLLKGFSGLNKPKMFVFISSVSVYGLDSGIEIDESYPLNAKDAYGKSKIMTEELLIKWCKENEIQLTILRLPLIVGDSPPGNLGSMINAVKKGYYFNIGYANARKSMVLGEDVSNYIIKVAPIGGIYNLTDGFHPTLYELSSAIAKKYNKKMPYRIPLFLGKILALGGLIFGNKFPLDPRKLRKMTNTLTFSDKRARKIFGWNPRPVLKYI